jgi:hypothetical protein
MLSLEHNGFYPLTKECIETTVPKRAGVYTLAIQLPNGVHKTFFTKGSEDINRSLRKLLGGDCHELSAEALEYMRLYRCYFTFFIILDAEQREAITKMLSSTCDPIVQLTMVNCN